MPILQVARDPAFEEINPRPKKAGVTGIGADDTRSGAVNLVPLVSNEPERRLLLSLKYLRVGDTGFEPVTSAV